MCSRFPVPQGKVFLENLKPGAQAADDFRRRTDQKGGEDLNGFGIEGLQFTQAPSEHAEFLSWG